MGFKWTEIENQLFSGPYEFGHFGRRPPTNLKFLGFPFGGKIISSKALELSPLATGVAIHRFQRSTVISPSVTLFSTSPSILEPLSPAIQPFSLRPSPIYFRPSPIYFLFSFHGVCCFLLVSGWTMKRMF